MEYISFTAACLHCDIMNIQRSSGAHCKKTTIHPFALSREAGAFHGTSLAVTSPVQREKKKHLGKHFVVLLYVIFLLSAKWCQVFQTIKRVRVYGL